MNSNASQERPLPHIPVMVTEVLEYLNLQPNGMYLDGTIGAGGHATEILNRLSRNGKLIGIDRDAEALKICNALLGTSARPLLMFQSSYHHFPKVLGQSGISAVNGILLDLGLSSIQLDSDSRGFAFESNGKLDMRFDGHSGETAAELMARSSEKELQCSNHWRWCSRSGNSFLFGEKSRHHRCCGIGTEIHRLRWFRTEHRHTPL